MINIIRVVDQSKGFNLKRCVHFRVIVLVLLVSLCLLKSVDAQEAIPTEELDDITEYTEQAQRYNILYLTGTPSPFIAPDALESALGAYHTSSWNEMLIYNELFPLDALILDSSALEIIDHEWLSNVYRKGVVLTFFDVDTDTIAKVLDIPPFYDGFVPPNDPYYVAVQRYTLAQNFDVLKLLDENEGDIIPDISGYTYGGQSFQHDTLITSNGYDGMIMNIVISIEGFEATKEQFLEEIFGSR